jgi:hypothetical protein
MEEGMGEYFSNLPNASRAVKNFLRLPEVAPNNHTQPWLAMILRTMSLLRGDETQPRNAVR